MNKRARQSHRMIGTAGNHFSVKAESYKRFADKEQNRGRAGATINIVNFINFSKC